MAHQDDEPEAPDALLVTTGTGDGNSAPTPATSNLATEDARISGHAGGDEAGVRPGFPRQAPAVSKPPTDVRGGFDEYGRELARDARIWPTYVKEAEKWDEDMVDGWNRSLDVILVFAALFSAISTAFVIESAKNLQQDATQSTATAMLEVTAILRAIAEGQAITPSSDSGEPSEFSPSFAAVCVNALWFLSLSLSVSVSLVAMLAKQWCHSYMSGRIGQPHVQARRRQRRLDGLERWKMPEILAFLPTLMHFSLILFFVGLTIYLWNIHTGVAIPVLVITTLTFIFYAATTILPVGNPYCPYNTPLSRYLELVLGKLLSPLQATSFARPFLPRQHEKDAVEDATGPLSDEVTSQALSWVIANSQDTRSVDLALQAIAGADSHMPVQPLVKCNVVTRLVGRFGSCFNSHPKTKFTSLSDAKFSEPASLYGRALAFVITRAPDQSSVASELRVASGTASDKRPWSIDRGYSHLEEEFALKQPNVSAFAAASMSSWREFWGRVEWPWPKAPLTRPSALLLRHVKGEISLHPTAIVSLVDVMSVEAARWFNPRIAEDRTQVAMTLVRLLAQSTQITSDPIKSAIGVTLAAFTLAIHNYPGGTNKPTAESRTRRALEAIRRYDSNQTRAEGHDELLMFGLLGLLNNPTSYVFTSEDVATIARTLALSHKVNTKDTPLPFLPPSFDLGVHLVNTVLVYLLPSASTGECSIDESARAALLNLLTLQPHTWAQNERLYTIIASNLHRAQTGELQLSTLAAIASQWAHTPPTYLLSTLNDQEIPRALLRIVKSKNSHAASMAMHSLWMIVDKTLELWSAEDYVVVEKPTEPHPSLEPHSVLRSIIDNGLFLTLAELFQATDDVVVVPHHVHMWLGILKGLSCRFPLDITRSNVLTAMADFCDSYTTKGSIEPVLFVGESSSISASLKELLDACTTVVH